ncbi:MAG: hypothetical protein VSS75_018035 [Candidatus Parabeggiatoa sp.]|nr:hypothetical protein [Candidatus Parabeggiatoa sp.]
MMKIKREWVIIGVALIFFINHPVYADDILDLLGGEELPATSPLNENSDDKGVKPLRGNNSNQSTDILELLGGNESPLNERPSKAQSPYHEKNKGENLIFGVPMDEHGNPECQDCELVKDRGFESCMIAVLHLYTGEGFDFQLPQQALEKKGFSIHRWANTPPTPKELEETLKKASQLWIISDQVKKLNEAHLQVIRAFFDSGKGIYIWGDNEPYYADANYLAESFFGAKMLSSVQGDETVGLQTQGSQKGLVPNHLITTGLQHVYEGITIASIHNHVLLNPLLYGSAHNLVAATYEKQGKRAIVDGGFTRLFLKWDTAGTGRYVKNAAGWLVNYERFGKKNCHINSND